MKNVLLIPLVTKMDPYLILVTLIDTLKVIFGVTLIK